MSRRQVTVRHCCAIAAVLVLSLGACKESELSGPDGNGIVALPSEESIMARAYDPTYQVPERFYVDERADTPRSFTSYHVLDHSGDYERCTDAFDTAYQWEAEDNTSRSVSGVYVGAIENERYFEFIRELSHEDDIGNIDDLTSPGFARIFKCSYLDRAGVDRHQRDGYAGTLGTRPTTVAALKGLTEYLWQFAFFWPARASVLETYSAETAASVSHTLRLALLMNRGDDQCDRIEVVDWTFSATVAGGAIEKRFNVRHVFDTRLVDGEPERCGR